MPPIGGLMAAKYADWEGPRFLEEEVFGTGDPEETAACVDELCSRRLGSRIECYEFFAARVMSVHGVRLADRRRVVVKIGRHGDRGKAWRAKKRGTKVNQELTNVPRFNGTAEADLFIAAVSAVPNQWNASATNVASHGPVGELNPSSRTSCSTAPVATGCFHGKAVLLGYFASLAEALEPAASPPRCATG